MLLRSNRKPETAGDGATRNYHLKLRSALIFVCIIGSLDGITLCFDRLLSQRSIPSVEIISNKSIMIVNMEGDDRLESESSRDKETEVFVPQFKDLMHYSDYSLSIVCQLSGEFGNNIGKFVHAYVLWLKLTRAAAMQGNTAAQFTYRIILRHQNKPKWVRARDDAQLCFPSSLGQFDFTLGNGPDFDVQRAKQKKLQWMEQFAGVNIVPEHVQGALENFTAIAAAKQHSQINFNLLETTDANVLLDSPISLPFLLSDRLVSHPSFVEFVDEHYQEIRRLLQFDEQACCALKPFPDESVFHHRNFMTELPKDAVRLGFEEMGPNQTARDLFGHLGRGDKVAIVSRFGMSTFEEQFIDALERQGLHVRFVQGQTGVQDFCFLMHAQKELVGPGKSSFFNWAAILGNATKIRSYRLDTPETRAISRGNVRIDYAWKNQNLRERFTCTMYTVDRELGRRWLSVGRTNGYA